MNRSLVIIAVGAGAMLAAACGKVGPLERPAPMFGAAAKARYEAEKSSSEANQPSAPKSTREQMDPATANRPVNETQLPGINDPFGQRPK
ncbi:hypothetical protein [Caulobacter sp. NIBR2454]|uniref:hypothetical protein n=1 Tax=Caulobacter sp. NIBR2454 TaxID=3015996 RepID=UPI0022B6F3F2|nr:hypothetical protein [Caulobacter sp. NIBR2454]